MGLLHDWREHVEDDLRADVFPEIEGLRSARLGEALSVQWDEQEGTLLLAGNDQQHLLSRDEVAALVAFLAACEAA